MALAVAAIAWAPWAGSGQPGPPRLLPDLVAQPPSDIRVRSVKGRSGGRFELGFRSAADNLGRGPLIVDAEADVRSPGELATTQVVRRVDGSEQRRPLQAKLRYVESADHSHFHLLGFMRYELRDARTHRRVGRDRKTGFCLGDRYDARPRRRLRGEPRTPPFDTDCGKNRPDLTALREGISVGYGDDYKPHLEGQEIEITRLRPGRYVLVHRVNSDRTLSERTLRNNVSSALIRIARPRPGARRVTLLKRCRASERCPPRRR